MKNGYFWLFRPKTANIWGGIAKSSQHIGGTAKNRHTKYESRSNPSNINRRIMVSKGVIHIHGGQ